MNLCNESEIKALLARHGFHFSKALGQNFLVEEQVLRDIAEASGAGPGTGVLEIGPGIGPLTLELSQRAERVTAVEVDRALLPILEETLTGCNNVTVISGDVRKLDLPNVVSQYFSGLTPLVCANLPYHITTPVLTLLLESRLFQQITVMIQKEVALRICAHPGTGDYGAFSVFCQVHANPEFLFEVPPSCFLPAPKVTSAVLRLTPKPLPDCIHDEALFFRTVRAAFGQRRKTLLNALSAVFSLPRDDLRKAVSASGLSEQIRGERLSISEFARLTDELKNIAHV